MLSEKMFTWIDQGGIKVYSGFMSVRELVSMGYVDRFSRRRKFDEEGRLLPKGSQRPLDEKHVKKIMKFLEDGNEPKFNSLVINCREGLNVSSGVHAVKFDFTDTRLSVVDGQHRFYSLKRKLQNLEKRRGGTIDRNIFNDYKVPVTIFDGVPAEEESGIFLGHNTTKSMDGSHKKLVINQQFENIDIQQLSTTDSMNRILGKVIDGSNISGTSHWYDKIHYPEYGSHRQQSKIEYDDRSRNQRLLKLNIAFEVFGWAYKELKNNNNIHRMDEDAQVKLLSTVIDEFWKALEQHSSPIMFEEPYKYCTFSALGIRVYGRILQNILRYYNQPDQETEVTLYTSETFGVWLEDIEALREDEKWLYVGDNEYARYGSAMKLYQRIIIGTNLGCI